MKQLVIFFIVCFARLLSEESEGHVIQFNNVSMYELVKFVSRIAGVNFVADQKLLDFEVSFISGKSSQPEDLLETLIHMLEQNGLETVEKKGCYLIRKASLLESIPTLPPRVVTEGKFNVYKLQYHQGGEILEAMKQIANDLNLSEAFGEDLKSTIQSMQWIKTTNSLFFSGSEVGIQKVCNLIQSLDTPLKQVFIEVLVIETNLNNSLDFGLKWSAGSKYQNHLGIGLGSPQGKDLSFANMMDSSSSPLSQIPTGRGFDLGIIGDIIFHKGKSFLSLGALISALQLDGDASIVLNQKIIAQENKNSEIFVGSNLPFAGAMVQTVGSGQQTTANIDYKDVGVSLKITPFLGEGDIITLEIVEQITEALDHPLHNNSQLSGIKTSKTNMSTSAHVPDGHFLILSGMTRTVESVHQSGIPCLGAIPFIGSLFSHKEKRSEKTNLMIFVKPHIIHSPEDYKVLSQDLQLTASNTKQS